MEHPKSNYCPHCGGRLIASDIVLTSYPPKYQATCEKCGKTFTSFSSIGFKKYELGVSDDVMWEN